MTAPTIEIDDNDGDIPLLVAACDAPFPSGPLDSGDTYAFTSSKAGAFACNRDLHPHEQGRTAAIR
ncbi:hypothetical protein [Mesorhizobium sp.]|uniref:hypothetical protein n=1 Tax=Mesorhizobium sp. TaxID=1871066 RepID=UPI0025C4298E|nr:hypothetical protein [Mesorhizobium sp.]